VATYVMLSRFSPEAFRNPSEFLEIARRVTEEINCRCPNVMWRSSHATLGRFDVIDIVESADLKQLELAAMIIRGHGHSITETLLATPWRDFLATLEERGSEQRSHSE
jgi:uncharacterized protein with GYD domain